MAAAAVATARACHHFHVLVLAFALLDGLDYFLDVSEAVALGHFYTLTLTSELILDKIAVFYLLADHITAI